MCCLRRVRNPCLLVRNPWWVGWLNRRLISRTTNTRLTGSATFARYGGIRFPTAKRLPPMWEPGSCSGDPTGGYTFLKEGRSRVTLTAGACSRAVDYCDYPVSLRQLARRRPSSVTRLLIVTAGILSVAGPEIEIILGRGDLDIDDPAFQPYVAAAWASFQNDMAGDRSGNRGKRVRFDGTTRQPEEILSQEVQAAAGQGVPNPTTTPASGATSGPTSRPDTSASRPPPASGIHSR
ncbi:hypothetical protein BU15DRAFT_60784 [Melanogaster broomeanus]|nr:hypothetical protein BU15DRAFT_60784 [Melanogaster broomeanus]